MNFLRICAFAALLVCLGCSKQSATNEQPGSHAGALKLGFVVKQPEEPWFQLEWKFADEAAAKDGFELIKIGAPDGEKVLTAIDNLAAGDAQGFVICTPDTHLGPAIVARAKSHNLKVISVDDQFLGPDGKAMTNVHYLGISARKIGQSVGQALYGEMKKRNWPEAETAVCVVTFNELDTAKERTDGAVEALKAAGFPEAKIFTAPQKTSDIPGAFDAVNILLTQQPDVKRWLICGMNDSAVLGAVRATEGRGFKADSVVGIGINGTDCIVEFEKDKPTGFFASALLAPKRHGYETADMLYKWVKDGVEPPLDTRTTGILINRDNYKQVLKEQGIRN
jgi:L-arabinose transport system substrate-binding protein